MQDREFVKLLRQAVIQDEIDWVKNVLDTETTESTRGVWREYISLYTSLTPQEKETSLRFLRMINVGIVSKVLGIIDGSSFLSDDNEGFILTTDSDKNVASGFLQDHFLEMEEESHSK